MSKAASCLWFKVFVERDGIYRLSYDELRNMGLSNPANVRIYGHGGAMLPELPTAGMNALQEIPVEMVCKTQGTFTSGDYLLFYGQGPVVWRFNAATQLFEHTLHLWDSRSCYLITEQSGGQRITTEAATAAAATQTVTAFDERLFHEIEKVNLLSSGRQWMGESFLPATPQTFTFDVPEMEAGAEVDVSGTFAIRSSSQSYLELSCGQQTVRCPLGAYNSEYTLLNRFSASFTGGSAPVEVTASLDGGSGTLGWLDGMDVQTRRRLRFANAPLFFRDSRSVGAGNITTFAIDNCSGNVEVWDITDMHHVARMTTELTGTTLRFTAKTDVLREFVAFRPSSGVLRPVIPDNPCIDSRDLSGIDADMIVVSNPLFSAAAEELAELHRRNDGLSVEVVTVDAVYRAFSSGMQDPAAIRNFAKTVYERTGRLKYLLLVGDGSYDNKSNLFTAGNSALNSNYMVTYQSQESLHSTRSFVSDDYFGILDDGESVLGGQLNIAVGRFPVRTAEEAQQIVNKIRRYMETSLKDDWPNRIVLLADDEDQNIHAEQSDSIARYLRAGQPQMTVHKLYFDAFPPTATADGQRYPVVTERLDELLRGGCLLVNYIGHGNASGLAEERVVNTSTIERWKNRILPVFVAATCEFGRYDDYRNTTAGEMTVLNPTGGAVSLITSTRLVYSSMNFQFVRNFFRSLFAVAADGSDYRLGDFVRLSKNASDVGVNKLCFALMGDPALRLPLPGSGVETLSVGEKAVPERDTLKANDRVTVTGAIIDRIGAKMTDFNGELWMTLYDKEQQQTTRNNDGKTRPMNFTTQTSVLYKGKASVRSGAFSVTFVMPRDINYSYGAGRISYFAVDTASGRLAAGGFDGLTVGGSGAPLDDSEGPVIRLFMNDTLFRDGGVTDQNPLLLALLSDQSGVSTAGGLGHDIMAVIDGRTTEPYLLNEYYTAETDDYRRGRIAYRTPELAEGEHTLRLTAWDVAGNPSEATLRFRVTATGSLHISRLFNYPNPFESSTTICFEYNRPDETIDMEMQIFDLSGRKVYSTRQSLRTEGYTSGLLQWNGCNGSGNRLPQGMYLCRVVLRSAKGQRATMTTKMVLR